jgi:hypothetical protein
VTPPDDSDSDDEPALDLYLETYEPYEDGFKLKKIKEVKLLEEDGAAYLKYGGLKKTSRMFVHSQGTCNGKILILHFKGKKSFFDVETGKLLLDKTLEDDEKYEPVCYDNESGHFYAFDKKGEHRYLTFKIEGFNKPSSLKSESSATES